MMLETQPFSFRLLQAMPLGFVTLSLRLEGQERYRQIYPLAYLEGWMLALIHGNPSAVQGMMTPEGQPMCHVYLEPPTSMTQPTGGHVSLFMNASQFPHFLDVLDKQLYALRNLSGGFPWTGEVFCSDEDKAYVRQKWELPDGCKKEWCHFMRCPLWVDSRQLSISPRHFHQDRQVTPAMVRELIEDGLL